MRKFIIVAIMFLAFAAQAQRNDVPLDQVSGTYTMCCVSPGDLDLADICFARVDLELCFHRIDKRLRMADENLHPMTLIQNARTSGGGVVTAVPSQAISVGPVETWKSQKVSIWHAGTLQLLKAAGCSLHYIMMTAANLVF